MCPTRADGAASETLHFAVRSLATGGSFTALHVSAGSGWVLLLHVPVSRGEPGKEPLGPTIGGKQRARGIKFDDATPLHDHHSVKARQVGELVTNGHHGGGARQEDVVDNFVRACVYGRSGFIEQDQRGALGQGPSCAEQLPLTRAEGGGVLRTVRRTGRGGKGSVNPTVALSCAPASHRHISVQLLRQASHAVEEAHFAQSAPDAAVSNTGVRAGHVVADCSWNRA